MKMLKKEPITVEENDIQLVVRQIDTETQSVMLTLIGSESIKDRCKLTKFALLNCIDSIVIKNKIYNPEELSKRCDLTDQDTLRSYLAIGEIAATSAYLDRNTEKK